VAVGLAPRQGKEAVLAPLAKCHIAATFWGPDLAKLELTGAPWIHSPLDTTVPECDLEYGLAT
jgi:hypothetical protein